MQDTSMLFQDGYEGGTNQNGEFINWDETCTNGGSGNAIALIDSIIPFQGNYCAKFEVTDGSQGGWAYTSKIIPWPSSKKVLYSCYMRNGPKSASNAEIGGIYFMEAYIIHPSGYRERANIETHPSEPGTPDDEFMLRMTYRGRDGIRHRQQVNKKYVKREQWYHIKMLVDLSGTNPYYAWWLNGEFVWGEYDTSIGNDTLEPTEFHAGACFVDWAVGNRTQVWIDECKVETLSEPVAVKENISESKRYNTSLTVNYNPLSENVNIAYEIPKENSVSIILYDICGREIKRILDNVFNYSGKHTISLNMSKYSQGIYFVKLFAGNEFVFKKLVLVR